MSVRRSARNAGKTATYGIPQTSNQNVDTNGAPEVPIQALHMPVAEQHPAPSPELQTKLDAQKKTTATIDAKAVKKKATAPKKTAAPKKAAAPRKRKAPTPSPGPSPSTSITNVVKISETLANTGASLESLQSNPSEALQSVDITKPTEIFTIPNGVPTSDPPRGVDDGLSLPSTPLVAKRRRKGNANTVSPAKPVPFTPTPSGVGLIAGPENVARKPKGRGKEKDADHMLDDLASMNRPADPHLTNAPVLTPNGSQVVVNDSPARKRKAAELPPDVGSPLKPANSTIETLLKDAEAYLINVDETGRLEKLIEKHHCKLFSPEGLREVVDPFTALASGIIGQQVSGAAAASIRKKFTALFSDTHPAFPSPAQVLTKDLPTLRTAGLSQRKAEYITGLASKFASGEFTAEGLVRASDEELIEKLVAVRGLGRWSVEMFACFGLKRMDVFSTGDLGVQRGMAAYMGRDVSKLKNKGGKWKYMSEQEMLSIASKFSPYRSLFMWYMWRIADVETEVLE